MCEHKDTGKKFAIKAVNKKSIQDVKTFLNELELGKNISHPNICKFIQSYQDSQYHYGVMEFCKDGDLLTYV